MLHINKDRWSSGMVSPAQNTYIRPMITLRAQYKGEPQFQQCIEHKKGCVDCTSSSSYMNLHPQHPSSCSQIRPRLQASLLSQLGVQYCYIPANQIACFRIAEWGSLLLQTSCSVVVTQRLRGHAPCLWDHYQVCYRTLLAQHVEIASGGRLGAWI
jgi:hypothetical protein